MFAAGGFEVFEVLPQRSFVKLREELRLDGDVIAADIVDELTFIHGRFTFEKRAEDAARATHCN